jgi:hypothetical protein
MLLNILYVYITIPIFFGFSIIKPILAGLSSFDIGVNSTLTNDSIACASASMHTISLLLPFLCYLLSMKMGKMGGIFNFIPLFNLIQCISVFILTGIVSGTSWYYYSNPQPVIYGVNVTISSIISIIDIIGHSIMYTQCCSYIDSQKRQSNYAQL